MAARSGVGAAGIGRLMADAGAPAALGPLKQAVARFNQGALKRYPGSPLLAAEALRKGDRLIACEVHPDDYESLRRSLAGYPGAKAIKTDGYGFVRENTPAGRLLVLIDPPFERPDDYERAASALGAILRKNRAATVAVWLPLKDLETFDAFLRRIGFARGALIVEVRLRPLLDPMKMNGCALVIANPPAGLEAPLREACEWVVSILGDAGGKARLWSL